MNTLVAVLQNPAVVLNFNNAQWEQLLGEGRRTRMLSRLWHLLAQEVPGPIPIPEAVADIMRGHAIYVAHMQVVARYELSRLEAIAAEVDYPVVLLKGIAYLEADLPVAPGRGLSDLDILVPRKALAEFEERLQRAGWRFAAGLSAYDERYYREWAHELPPMRHPGGTLELDVHHNLIQPTSAIKLDIAPVLAASSPLAGSPFHLPASEDLVLHSALHLLMSDELRGGIRDLYDIHVLCAHFANGSPEFWTVLVRRAQALGLLRPLYYALSATREMFAAQVPVPVWEALCMGRPPAPVDAVMRRLIRWHLAPLPGRTARSALAMQLLFIRSHWIRMPPLMLFRHLSRKLTTRESVG